MLSINPYVKLLELVSAGQAALIAKWMQSGFIHGVMNTDNMSIAGETIDYGPCAFMDDYSHDRVYSSIDRDGRYAYSNQPSIGLWNLTRFAESIVPLLSEQPEQAVEIAKSILNNYILQYENNWLSGMKEKSGLSSPDATSNKTDKILIDELFELMEDCKADFTLVFYYLSKLDTVENAKDNNFISQFKGSKKINLWLDKWRNRLVNEKLSDEQRQHQIEAAIRAAEDHNDFSVFDDLHTVLERPFTEQKDKESYMLPPKEDEIVWKTFCGT